MAIRFDNQVAIVTGAGNGLGRSYALALARRGAKVVVNDLGGAKDGGGQDATVAQKVVDEIKSQGGIAIANCNSVTDDAGVEQLIGDALKAFGRIDILIANAGIHRAQPFETMSAADFKHVMEMHTMGTMKPVKAVWAQMKHQRYGRIVVTTSAAGLFGFEDDAHYGAGKMAIVGLMNTLKIEGEVHGIRINAIAPIAATRMGQDAVPAGGWDQYLAQFNPDLVAPGVMYLASDNAPTGVILSAGGGVFSCVEIRCAHGINLGHDVDVDAIGKNWAAINDFSTFHRFNNAWEQGDIVHAMIADGPTR